jgi:hypothetical protein
MACRREKSIQFRRQAQQIAEDHPESRDTTYRTAGRRLVVALMCEWQRGGIR